MTLSNRLEKLRAKPEDAAPADEQAPPLRRRSTIPLTSPGQLFASTSELAARDERIGALERELGQASGELDALRAQLAALDADQSVRKLDPARVRASRLANRIEASFGTPEFGQLKREIELVGGNVQPIKVRPVTGDARADYEIVYGHRRHRAALELGLPVRAVVQEMDDEALFREMELENRGRADLRPYELALHYRNALDAALYPSQSQMAKVLGITQGHLSKLAMLGNLPQEVVAAFASPLDLTVRMGVTLHRALQKDRRGVLRRAEKLAAAPRLPASKVMQVLLEEPADTGFAVQIGPNGIRALGKGGAFVLELGARALDQELFERLVKAVEPVLQEGAARKSK